MSGEKLENVICDCKRDQNSCSIVGRDEWQKSNQNLNW